MNAVIDFGNTQTKLGVFEQDELIQTYTFSTDEQLLITLNTYSISRIIIANVGKTRSLLVNKLEEHYQVIIFSYKSPMPIVNRYETPQTLGVDRLAAVIGATVLFPNEACLVIDMGTCITYDFITTQKEYLGGGISPGMKLRTKAMNSYTANLPLIEDFDGANLVGKTTISCLKSGIVHGIACEVDGLIEAYKKRFGIFNTVLCGGDAIFFESKVKASIFVRQEIVLLGLYEVLKQSLNTSGQ